MQAGSCSSVYKGSKCITFVVLLWRLLDQEMICIVFWSMLAHSKGDSLRIASPAVVKVLGLFCTCYCRKIKLPVMP